MCKRFMIIYSDNWALCLQVRNTIFGDEKYGWLECYASTEGIRLVLNQMSRRKNINQWEMLLIY
ncbi:MAG: hypothetical protein CM15mP59_5700 [Flavobacteriaceae bacterium]|nr:MAG: hypothetical protein CM15mP59_5700 [Flavobacteriaceae bacterium]